MVPILFLWPRRFSNSWSLCLRAWANCILPGEAPYQAPALLQDVLWTIYQVRLHKGKFFDSFEILKLEKWTVKESGQLYFIDSITTRISHGIKNSVNLNNVSCFDTSVLVWVTLSVFENINAHFGQIPDKVMIILLLLNNQSLLLLILEHTRSIATSLALRVRIIVVLGHPIRLRENANLSVIEHFDYFMFFTNVVILKLRTIVLIDQHPWLTQNLLRSELWVRSFTKIHLVRNIWT